MTLDFCFLKGTDMSITGHSSDALVLFTTLANFRTSVIAPDNEDPLGENPREWAMRVLPYFPHENLSESILSLVAVIGSRYVRELLFCAACTERLKKEDFKLLYCTQFDAVFEEGPIVTLVFLLELEDSKKQKLFSFEDVLLVEEARHSITGAIVDTMQYVPHVSDLSYFLFDEEHLAKISTPTLKRWEDNLPFVMDMDMPAVIDAELLLRKEIKLSQGHIGRALELAAKHNPTGNATKTYLKLLFIRSPKKGSVRIHIVDVLTEMLSPTGRVGKVDFETAKSILQFYINNPLIPKEDREWVIAEMKKHCAFFAKQYLQFVDDAKEKDPFKLQQ